ncbi:alpha/beta hydrolase [Deinococcus peraridilitoris]|nr:alpha/beta hydrolase [Deinococcus peraridilitoris]
MDHWDFGRSLAGYGSVVPGARAQVLLVHGYAEHVGRYTHLIEALVRANFSVYAFDQRGHGRSPGPRALLRLRDLTDDHLAARAWLRQHAPEVPTFAVGHSVGGLVTALSLARDPRGLRGVVLSSPALVVGQEEPAAKRAALRLLSRVAPRTPVSVVAKGILSRDPEIDRAFEADTLCYSGRVQARSAYEMMTGADALWGKLGNWTLPTLVIHGDADRLITIEGSRRFVRNIASQDRELWEAPGGYHELFNDLDSQLALDKVTGWLAARSDSAV